MESEVIMMVICFATNTSVMMIIGTMYFVCQLNIHYMVNE